jgi:hypothetical protein
MKIGVIKYIRLYETKMKTADHSNGAPYNEVGLEEL